MKDRYGSEYGVNNTWGVSSQQKPSCRKQSIKFDCGVYNVVCSRNGSYVS